VRGVVLFFALILITLCLCAQEKKPWNVARLCGRVEHVKRTPERHSPDSFAEKRKSLRDVFLNLYERHENVVCCEGVDALETVRAGRGGHFEFKIQKAGDYWLTSNWNGKASKIAVVYEPQKVLANNCSEQGIQLDDEGNAGWWITVTVD
jgi:hypothetical protein